MLSIGPKRAAGAFRPENFFAGKAVIKANQFACFERASGFEPPMLRSRTNLDDKTIG